MKPARHTKTLKVRIRDKHAKVLRDWAWAVNQVWNYCNELSYRAISERQTWFSGYDLQRYTKGAGKELGLNSATVQMVGHEYALRRKQFKKNRLNWRKSGGVRRSLGWIPVRKDCIRFKNGCVHHNKHTFKVWDSYGLSHYVFRAGNFNEDARGHWYFNVVVEVEADIPAGQDSIGIDLGLKETATCSDGTKLEAGRFYRDQQEKLAIAQRARKKKRVKAIHAKISNRRKDALHKFSRELVNRSGEIYVGNVKSSSLTQTWMAKSVLDAGWAMLKTMLSYKCDHAGIVFKEVNESYTTQTCSNCGTLPDSRPRGISGLGIREWACSECGVTHDRDVNAARNILAVGHGRPVEGIRH
jgi:IS605 OrfB family transposase